MTSEAEVNPETLVWARETAGLSVTEAAKSLPIGDAYGLAAAQRLRLMEAGEAFPTRATLVKMSRRYRRPLLSFYLAKPPKIEDAGADFRTLAPGAQSPSANGLVDALIRGMKARQSIVRSALEEEEEAVPIGFVGSKSMADGSQNVAHSLQNILGGSIDEFHRRSNADKAFEWLRERVEHAGVFVILQGNLGNYRTALDTELFRGFTLADDVAPFIVINDNDSHSAWSFTLAHEMTHLLLGQTGIDGSRVEGQVEQFCNDTAGNLLLPVDRMNRLPPLGVSSIEDDITEIENFARELKVSGAMVAYRAYRTDRIDHDTYDRIASMLRDRWSARRRLERERRRNQETPIGYYVIKRHRTGRALIDLTRRMMSAGAMSTKRAALTLGVKATQVHHMTREGS